MKRVPELRDLSEDHHHALVLAWNARQVAAGASRHPISETWTEVEQRFQNELEPHFQIEEVFLAPLLESQGQVQLVKRLNDEHAVLRAAVAADSGRTASDLQRFGELLEQHVRFEERELFETAQQCLSAEELSAVANACRARRELG